MKLIKIVLLVSFCLFAYSVSYSQSGSLERKLFFNDSIKYHFIFVSPGVLSKGKDKISKYIVRINMPKEYKKYLLSQDSTFWIPKLSDEQSDWATSLILYCIYDQDASMLVAYETRQKWLRIKMQQIDFWRKFLSVPSPPTSKS